MSSPKFVLYEQIRCLDSPRHREAGVVGQRGFIDAVLERDGQHLYNVYGWQDDLQDVTEDELESVSQPELLGEGEWHMRVSKDGEVLEAPYRVDPPPAPPEAAQ